MNIDGLDVIGIGIGPFNLSLAALLSPIKQIESCFLDQTEQFIWHSGMLLPNAEIQVNYLKDLVTLVDPTNPYSFISYLAKHKRLYRFIHSQFKHVLRKEFNQYLQWVSRSLPNLFFQEKVNDIQFDGSHFIINATKRQLKAKHLVLGHGLTPYLPEFVKPYVSPRLFHNQDYLFQLHNFHGKRVAVIGGGQSGAEVIQHILSQDTQLPAELTWITNRNHFLPMDESVFVNELFTPPYSDYFFQLSATHRTQLLKEQGLASDGISQPLLEAIYQKLYVLEHIENHSHFFNFLPHHTLTDLHIRQNTQILSLINSHTEQKKQHLSDITILCTGYRWQFPDYLSSLAQYIPLIQGQFSVKNDFSINWEGPKQNRIYVQNAARHTHGIADPNLSLMAWRSAKIINSIAESQLYDIDNESIAVDWHTMLFNDANELKDVSNA